MVKIINIWVAGSFKGKGIGKELLEYAKKNNIGINFIKIDKVHTTEMSINRIKKNLKLENEIVAIIKI